MSHCKVFKTALESRLRLEHPNINVEFIASVEVVQKESIYGFSRQRQSPFLQITTSSHNYLHTAKRVLENGFSLSEGCEKVMYTTFESNLFFILRFMIDTRVDTKVKPIPLLH